MSERHLPHSSQHSQAKSNPAVTNEGHSDIKEVNVNTHHNAIDSGQRFNDSLILLCCDDGLHLYSLNFVLQVHSSLMHIQCRICLISIATYSHFLLQGEERSICNLDLSTTCCWTTIFKTDGKDLGLILFYQNGLIEIRLSLY